MSIRKSNMLLSGIASLMIGIISGLVGCSASSVGIGSQSIDSNGLPMIEEVNIETITTNEIRDERTHNASLLAQKMAQAEFTIMALNDKKFIRQALGSDNTFSDNYIQCVYDNIERAKYQQELQGVALYLVERYPQDIDSYLSKLDFLIPIVRKIYQHPDPVAFNTYNLASSTALTILAPTNAQELMSTINDYRYAPLLATIGLPAKRADGMIEDISIMQVDSMMGYVRESADKCR